MNAARHFLAVCLFLVWAGNSWSQTVLDLVPPEATAGIAIRNLDELKTRGDQFVADAGLQNQFRPSQLFVMGLQFLGINGGIDTKNAAALVLAPPEKGQDGINIPNLDQHFVLILPFSELNALAANFGFEKGQLKPGKMARGKGMNFGSAFFARGKHLYVGNSEEAVARLLKSKPARDELSPAQVKALNESDLLIHVNPRAIGKEWEFFIDSLRNSFGKKAEPAEQRVVDQFLDTVRQLRYGIGTMRVDKGLGFSLLAVLPKEPRKPVKEFMAALGTATAPSSLKGLPEGQVLAAQANQGDGEKTGFIAKVLFDWVLQNLPADRRLLAAVDQPVVVGIFTEVWSHLKGNRLALYRTKNEHEQGLLSGVGILDTEDGGRFLASLRILARIADGAGLELNPKEAGKGLVDVDKLIQDLGDVRFRVRESATLKLRLLGEAALSYLGKARKSADLEVARRADQLYGQITQAAAQRRKELLSQDVLGTIRPTFAYIAGAEKRHGHAVDVVRLQLSEKDQPRAKPFMKQLLGPEWHNLRLVAHGKQVLAFFGSDLDLLDQALRNLDKKQSGLEGAPVLQAFRRQANAGRKIEFHLSMETILGMIAAGAAPPGKQGNNAPALSSLGLTVGTNFLQLDVWAPSREVGVIARRNGW